MAEMERMQGALSARSKSGLLRTLRLPDPNAVDFASNDYLGVSRRRKLSHEDPSKRSIRLASGATGSRLLSGNSIAVEELECIAARFHRAPSALLFNSGYDANLALFSCAPAFGDIIIYDELIHASVHDGMRLGRGRDNRLQFPHNCVFGLRKAVLSAVSRRAKSMDVVGDAGPRCTVFVAVEAVYSMDGDTAPLAEIMLLADELSTPCLSVVVIVDEAHGVGLVGPNGEGLCVAQSVHEHKRLFARVVTYGKAFGAHGACVLGSSILRTYLINFARPLIYSTCLPPHSIETLARAYDYMTTEDASRARQTLALRRNRFRSIAEEMLPHGTLLEAGSESPIQGILVPGNGSCITVADILRKRGFEVYPIRSPTVPKGTERIRIIIHSYNSESQIVALVEAMGEAIRYSAGDELRRKASM